jgi:hypothetical protein
MASRATRTGEEDEEGVLSAEAVSVFSSPPPSATLVDRLTLLLPDGSSCVVFRRL